ncbi:MAG: OsmC family protein [Ignavibacteriales bacterium]|nr:OsmC family protein [Ignavibacteriales bacterium]
MAKKTALVKQLHGITLAAKSDSNHWLMMDGSPTFGGSNASSSPKELLLMSLGGCTAMDVLPILQKKKVPITGFEINLNGNTRDEHPQVFTDIHVEYVFYGDDIDKKEIERAIELSTTKYCSVSAMLRESVKITHSYLIKSPEL